MEVVRGRKELIFARAIHHTLYICARARNRDSLSQIFFFGFPLYMRAREEQVCWLRLRVSPQRANHAGIWAVTRCFEEKNARGLERCNPPTVGQKRSRHGCPMAAACVSDLQKPNSGWTIPRLSSSRVMVPSSISVFLLFFNCWRNRSFRIHPPIDAVCRTHGRCRDKKERAAQPHGSISNVIRITCDCCQQDTDDSRKYWLGRLESNQPRFL